MIAPQLFPFLRVFNYFIDFFSSIFPRLCRCCVSAVLQPHTCNFFYRISHKVARSHFSSKSGRAFRPGGSRGGFAPYAPGLSAPSCSPPVWYLFETRRSEWFGRFSVWLVAILRPRLRSSLTLLEKHFSSFPFVLCSGLSLHCGGLESVSENRMAFRAANVPLESRSW